MQQRVSREELSRFLDAWMGVRQIIQAANFNRFQRAGLSATQFMTLNLLPASGAGMPTGDLARAMNLKPSTVAETLNSLEVRGLVVRARGADDRRVILVKATRAGAVLQNAASQGFQAHMRKLFAGMSARDRAGLIAGLESMVRQAAGKPAATRGEGRPHDGGPPAVRSARRSPAR